MSLTRLLFAFILGISAFQARPGAAQQDAAITFGVLAFGGEADARARWGVTVDYLARHLERPVRLQPLTLDGADAALEAQSLHFLLTNPGHYQTRMQRYGLAPLLSLRTDAPGRARTGNRYGAVIFARRTDGVPQRLSDLKGKRFGAVAPEAFGGWQLALHTLRRHGLDPARDFADLQFYGFPQTAIVLAVQDGAIDAGTVRTGVLEAMIAKGHVAPDALTVLNPLDVPGFEPMLSTALVPEWLIAATPMAPPDLRRATARALLRIEPGPGMAAGLGAGWLPPHSQAPVLEIRDALETGTGSSDLPRTVVLLLAGGLLTAALLVAAAVLWRRLPRPALAALPTITQGPDETAPATGPTAPLTPRETEILTLVEQGQTSKEIARTLSISPKTVEFHRHNLLLKFEAANMVDLVHRAGAWRRQHLPNQQPS